MGNHKLGRTKNGKDMHYSVGALIKKDGKYFLIDRAIFPLGFAEVADHIDGDESPEEALKRELKEEVGLDLINHKLIFEEEVENTCSKGVDHHYWYVFECEVNGKVKRSERETHSASWYTQGQIRTLKLEPVWEYWFKKLGII